MSRYGARLRQLESKLAPGACPVCAGYPAIDFVTVHGDEPPPPPPPPCEACGKLKTRFIVHHATESNEAVAHSQQRAAESLPHRAPVAESVPTAPKPRTRRRQWYG